MQADAVLFDVGDTLLWLDESAIADHLGVSAAAVARAVLDMRRRVDMALLSDDPPEDAAQFDPALALIELVGVAPEARPQAAADLHQLDRAGGLWCVIPPGIHEALERLAAAGLRLAAISNSDGSAATKVHAAGLDRHLEWVMDSELEGVAKPDPELFHRGVARLGVPAERCVYVGDVYAIDVLGAQRAGLQAILFDRTGHYRADQPGVVRSFTELADALTAP